MTQVESSVTERSRVRQLRERGNYDRAVAYRILDEGLVCHAGFQIDGQPYVIPMLYGRDGDDLLLHGAIASRFQRQVGGLELCVTVTLLDALVLARSTFHHSANYRSVAIFGNARVVSGAAEKAAALDRLVEHILPGRGVDARPGNRKELNATGVMIMPIREFSVKSRSGGPKDAEADLSLPVWAGVLPLHVATGTPQADEHVPGGLPVPGYVTGYRRGDPA